MRKTLLSTLVLGLLAGTACAQTNVTIYGQVDTGIMKETGSDTRMGNNENSLIGFKGTEDLGSGTKAVFRLEQRFNGNDGTKYSDNNALDKLQGSDGAEWQGAAYVGLADDSLGTVTLGRVNDIAIENYGAVDP
ncbi:MAG: porin, partial [Oxalobacter sp.]